MKTYAGKPITVWSVWSHDDHNTGGTCTTFRDKGLAKRWANRLRFYWGEWGYTYYIRPHKVTRCRYRDW